jgi:hypothetical protein
MSFYNTQSPANFNIQAPEPYTQQHLQFLEAGFNQPLSGSSLNSIANSVGVTLSANQLVNAGYIARSLVGAAQTDTSASASAIIEALNNNQAIRQLSSSSSPITVAPGFSFNLIYNNLTANAVSLAAGTGVTIGTAISLAANKVSILKFIVTNSSSGSEAVYVSLLGN